jgi:dipeptidyl aminopeptidase/acylaminoacyl peptidase
MKTDFHHYTPDDNLLKISMYGDFGDRPCILYVHGFKGFKDWGFVPYAGEYFAKQGMTFIAFNFSHNGIGEDLETFTEVDKFSRNTFSLEVRETLEVVRLITQTDFFGDYLVSHNLGIIGHSRGGGISLLSAQKSPDIKAVATWSSVSTFDRYDKKVRQAWKKKGYHEVKNSRTGQVFHLGLGMLADIEKNTKKSLNILEAAKNLEKPLLLLHGSNDESVPYYEVETLNIYASPPLTQMKLIPGAGHTFGAKHPFEGSTESLELVLGHTLKFFREELK